MVLDYRPIGARNPSGASFSHGFFTPEENKHSKTDYVGVFADGLIGRRDRRAAKDDMCITLNHSPFAAAASTTGMIVEDDHDSSCSRSSSRTGDSERTSHTSCSFDQQQHQTQQQQQQQRHQEDQLPGEPYSPATTVHHGRSGSYPTPHPTSKPQTPVRTLKMQRFPSLSGVDLSNLPPTPDSLRATPLFGAGLDGGMGKRKPSPEIPGAGDLESEEELEGNSELEGDEEDEDRDGLEDDGWEDVEEDEEMETNDEDSEMYETATDADEHDINPIFGEEEEEEEEVDDNDNDNGEGQGQKELHLDDKNTDEDLEEDGAYTPKLRAKLEASPQLSPILEPATTFSSPPPTISTSDPTSTTSATIATSLLVTNLPSSILPSTEPPLLVNRTFKLTPHSFSRPSSSSLPNSHPSSLSPPSSSSFSSPLSSVNPPSSFSEDHPSTSAASYVSGPSTSDPHPDTSASSSSCAPSSSVVSLLSEFIGDISASSPSSGIPSASGPLDHASSQLSGSSINGSSNSSSERCSGPSIRFLFKPSSQGLSRPSSDLPIAPSPSEKLSGMAPYIRITKTGRKVSLLSSTERKAPKAGSCIPEGPSDFRKYAAECVRAADAGRLNPWYLHEGEYELLRNHLNQLHVTTYLNIRNGILRLWGKNPKKRLTKVEAMGCCKEERYFGLAEVAFDWLTRCGYINHGCLEIPTSLPVKKPTTRRRKTIAIIGAGISGLAAARQLEALLASSGEGLGGSGVPDVVVFEGRNRLGGRVFSNTLTSGPHNLPDGLEPAVDIGGQIVMGYEARNPLAALIVDQLEIPYHTIGGKFPIHDYDGKVIGDGRDTTIELVHNDILRRLSKFSYKEPQPQTARGDAHYIDKCKDPWGVGGPPLALDQGDGHVAPPNPPAEKGGKKKEAQGLRRAIEGLDIKVAKGYNEDGLASLGRTMEGVLPGYANLLKTDARDLRLFNWFQANLEYANAVDVDGSSLEHWDQDDGNEPAGAHTMIMGGYSQLAKGLCSKPSALDVRLDHIVTRIKYDPKNNKKKVALQFADGTDFEADKVIVTLPLGVLKRDDGVDFVPPLPRDKRDAIKRLGFGLLNKVILVYEEAFWNTKNDGFGCLRKPDEGQDEDLLSSYKKRGRFYIWWNTTNAVGRPTLVGLMVGDAAEQVENEDPEEVLKEATAILKKCWGEDKVPNRPEECFVTKWRRDPFAFGSYSYVAPGSTGADYDTIAEPINDQIFFAGEHTSRKYPATVHGAYISGLRVAGEVAEAMLGPIKVPTPLIGRRVIKSRAETVIEATAARAANAQMTRSNNVRVVKTAKIQRARIVSRKSAMSTIVQRNSKRKALAEDHYRVTAKKARTKSSQAQIPQQQGKRKAVYEPESEVRPVKKARVPSVQAEDNPTPAVDTDPKPEEPRRDTANPFLIYQKDFFKIAQNRANQTKREQTGIPGAKADRNEVRVVLGDMWRTAAADTKNRYQDQANRNKRDNIARLNDYKRLVEAWQSRQATSVGSTIALPAAASSSPPTLIPSAVYPTPADTTPSVDDRDMAL
ncbi:hypothetical protein TWF481_007326 [Arthrobotrys musiformis]|uniref:SWIRM domain-containing protein n=1 Tax=Arthrobotrys musiformis TaxID=47236 RepID=A0AAV9WD67_9PEZI